MSILKKTWPSGFPVNWEREPLVSGEVCAPYLGADHYDRYLTVGGHRAYRLGGQFLFQRLPGAPASLPRLEVAALLDNGVADFHLDLIYQLSPLVLSGGSDLFLLEIRPTAVEIGAAADYFANEQREIWPDDEEDRIDTFYYRSGTRKISSNAKLFEFVVPMVPISVLNPQRIDEYVTLLDEWRKPTALAVSILDVCENEWIGSARHWCLAHYLLDGHHKMEAAARSGKSVNLISLLAHRQGIATPEQLEALGSMFDFE